MTLDEFKHAKMKCVAEEGGKVKVMVYGHTLPVGKLRLGPGVPGRCAGTFMQTLTLPGGSIVLVDKRPLDHLITMIQNGLEVHDGGRA